MSTFKMTKGDIFLGSQVSYLIVRPCNSGCGTV